jgi:hypothetical protein
MLVIHWARQNSTGHITKNGIRPSSRRDLKGVYVYPFSMVPTLSGNWRRNLKALDHKLGNYNGFIFRLVPDDFPLIAGYWFFNRSETERCTVHSLDELSSLYGDLFSGEIATKSEDGIFYNWEDFEIIMPRHIESSRIMKIIQDRPPKKSKTSKD